MKVEKAACVKCTRAIVQPETGRPRSYCGEPCRRAAEFEVRRIVRSLERLEEDRRRLSHTKPGYIGRRPGYSGGLDELGRSLAEAQKDIADDIAELEGRLRVLVAQEGWGEA